MLRSCLSKLLRTGLCAGLATIALGCGNAGDGLGITIPRGPNIVAQVYYDLDFNNVPSAPGVDNTFAGIRIYLLVAGTRDTVDSGFTDAGGFVTFTSPPLGPYTITVDSAAALGDSMLITPTPATVTIAAGGGTKAIVGRLGYPVLTVGDLRTSTAGRRAVVTGTVLAGKQSFSDTTANMRDTSGAIRLTNVKVVSGGFTAPGDSVRVLGTVSQRNGQPVLDSARAVLLHPGLPTIPLDTLTTAQAAQALGGTRDANLAFVGGTMIIDTLTVGADFRVTVDDGSGQLEVLFDQLVPVNAALFIPGDSLRATGVLVPVGGGQWQLRPRATQDATVF